MTLRQRLYPVKQNIKMAFDADYRFDVMRRRGWYRDMPDDEFLRRLYKVKLHRELNLEHPRLFTEKLQWLKLYDRRPEYTRMVDKYEAKEWVTSIVGEGHVVPAYGVWESFDEIDFDALPERFVFKCTHDSGGTIVCENKKTFDYDGAREKLTARLQSCPYWYGREWVYKNVKPRIIAEKYIEGLGGVNDVEYKLTCLDGKAKLITVCRGVPHATLDTRTNDFYDEAYRRLPFYAYYKNADPPVPLPENVADIVAFCEKLAQGIPQVRTDCYLIDGEIYFGEMTFYTWSGMIEFTPPEWDEILGGWLRLPEQKTTEETTPTGD